RVRELDELPTVIAERLRRSNGAGGAPAVADLLKQPHAAATDAVRGWLLSDALAGSEDYIEAQVRRMAPEDLLGAVIDTRPNDDVARRVSIHPGAAPGSGQVDALRAALELHQVPAVIR